MGNITHGLKIRKICKNNILKEITYGYGEKLIEYICFIIKLNDTPIKETFQEEQNKTNYIVHNFSIYNIINKKEYKIKLDSTNNKLFFYELEVEYCKIPNLHKILIISNILENSIAKNLNIKPYNFTLLGNEEKYFDRMDDISNFISNKKAEFILYNFVKRKIKKVNFEKFRVDAKEFTIGIECEIMLIDNFNIEYYNNIILNNKIDNNLFTVDSTIQRKTSLNNLDNNNILENEKTHVSVESKIEINNIISEKQHIPNDNFIIEEDNLKKDEAVNLIVEETILFNNSPKNNNLKYFLKKPKGKFQKKLKIYEHLDTHYNFLGSNYKKDDNESNFILQKSVILIKGYSLINIEEGQNSNSILSINNLYNNLKIKYFHYIF